MPLSRRGLFGFLVGGAAAAPAVAKAMVDAATTIDPSASAPVTIEVTQGITGGGSYYEWMGDGRIGPGVQSLDLIRDQQDSVVGYASGSGFTLKT